MLLLFLYALRPLAKACANFSALFIFLKIPYRGILTTVYFFVAPIDATGEKAFII